MQPLSLTRRRLHKRYFTLRREGHSAAWSLRVARDLEAQQWSMTGFATKQLLALQLVRNGTAIRKAERT